MLVLIRAQLIVWRAYLPSTPNAEQTMGMPAVEGRRWTAAEVRALPEDGNRYEVVDGELLVSPGPSYSHQRAKYLLQRVLDDYLTREHAGMVMDGPADVEPDDHTLVEPDLFVLPLNEGFPPASWSEARRLLLVIEILSPSSGRQDRVVKRRLYQRMGVEYWIVDPASTLLERWLPHADSPRIHTEQVEWRAEGAARSITIDLVAIFRGASLGKPS